MSSSLPTKWVILVMLRRRDYIISSDSFIRQSRRVYTVKLLIRPSLQYYQRDKCDSEVGFLFPCHRLSKLCAISSTPRSDATPRYIPICLWSDGTTTLRCHSLSSPTTTSTASSILSPKTTSSSYRNPLEMLYTGTQRQAMALTAVRTSSRRGLISSAKMAPQPFSCRLAV